jgi:hypothetical protein
MALSSNMNALFDGTLQNNLVKNNDQEGSAQSLDSENKRLQEKKLKNLIPNNKSFNINNNTEKKVEEVLDKGRSLFIFA